MAPNVEISRWVQKVKKGMRQFGKTWILKIIYPMIYKIHAHSKIKDDKIVFIENRSPVLTSNFSLLFTTLSSQYDCEIKCCYLRETEKKGYNRRCRAMISETANARYVFVNDSSNIVGCLPFRSETSVIQVWHACGAFKKWGFSNAEGQYGADRKELCRFPLYAPYSLVTISSPEIQWAYQEAFNITNPDIVQATGVSRTDVFFDRKFIDAAFAHLYSLIPQARDKKVVLYAPTFRGRVREAKSPDDIDQRQFRDQLADRYVLLIKHHPSVDKRPPVWEGCESAVYDVTEDLTIEELLCVSDICITDYSSILFEYSLFEKPILIYAYDIDQYTDWRGFYYDFESFVPGPILHNSRELFESLDQIDGYDLQPVKRFKQKFMSACDGHSTERIIHKIFRDTLPKKEMK